MSRDPTGSRASRLFEDRQLGEVGREPLLLHLADRAVLHELLDDGAHERAQLAALLEDDSVLLVRHDPADDGAELRRIGGALRADDRDVVDDRVALTALQLLEHDRGLARVEHGLVRLDVHLDVGGARRAGGRAELEVLQVGDRLRQRAQALAHHDALVGLDVRAREVDVLGALGRDRLLAEVHVVRLGAGRVGLRERREVVPLDLGQAELLGDGLAEIDLHALRIDDGRALERAYLEPGCRRGHADDQGAGLQRRRSGGALGSCRRGHQADCENSRDQR